ncbi:substrate-binding periplasmic protein [Spartinivicinus ruber]|uniref:substrate-binding periplasmic protein n=1 Tax=Spartinivicinus ruber TaxID=2683272 RepID=UPI0013D29172|nr:transporter substrate-binding domain-containing protein [Spartinivicinus ruber]
MYKILLTWLIFLPVLTSAEPISISTGEWPPFTDSKANNHGIGLQIVKESFGNVGHDVTFKFFPWKRAYSVAKDAEYQASAIWAKNDDRTVDFYYSDPVIDNETVFLYLEGTVFNWETLADLKKYKVGITTGYSYGQEFDTAVKNSVFSVSTITSDLQNIKKLLAGRIEVFPIEINVGYSIIKSNFPADKAAKIKHHPKILNTSPTYLIVPKKLGEEKAKKIVNDFNKGLSMLKEKGRYKEILNSIR